MKIDFLVEEPSMKALLGSLLPRLIPQVDFDIYDLGSKQKLLNNLPQRLRGYADMIKKSGYDYLRVVVLVDRDRDDCRELKRQLEEYAWAAGLTTLNKARVGEEGEPTNSFHVVNRIVCEELEAWYFGDPTACEAAYPRLKKKDFTRKHLLSPDNIAGGTWEAFERILSKVGIIPVNPPNKQWKYEAAEAIGAHLDPETNTSPSFQAFVKGIRVLESLS